MVSRLILAFAAGVWFQRWRDKVRMDRMLRALNRDIATEPPCDLFDCPVVEHGHAYNANVVPIDDHETRALRELWP